MFNRIDEAAFKKRQKALRAKLVVRRDVDYVVNEEGVQLVDENTGRIFADRSWRDGFLAQRFAQRSNSLSPAVHLHHCDEETRKRTRTLRW